MGGSCNCCWYWKRKPPNQSQTVISSASSTQPLSAVPNPPSTSKKPAPTLQEVISNFKNIDLENQVDGFITAIEEILKTAQKPHDAPGTSANAPRTEQLSNLFKSGAKFIKFVDEHTDKMKTETENGFFQSEEATEIIGRILEQIGHVHWVVAGLSMVGYLASKCAQVSKNKAECLEVLQKLITLLSHIKHLNKTIIEEKPKFEKAFRYIMEASISCASQLGSGKFFSFLKSTVNSQTLTAIHSKVSDIYRDLNLTATEHIMRQKTLSPPLLPQAYPSEADVAKCDVRGLKPREQRGRRRIDLLTCISSTHLHTTSVIVRSTVVKKRKKMSTPKAEQEFKRYPALSPPPYPSPPP